MDAATAATRIQAWFNQRMAYYESRTMIRLLSHSDNNPQDILHFLQYTTTANRHPELLAMLRNKYLAQCQHQAREDISISTYHTFIEAIVICGGVPTAEAQTDHEMKRMVETWERELVSPGYIQTKREQQLRSNEVKQSVKNGNSDAYLRTMVDKGAFDTGFALQHFTKLRQIKPRRKETPAKQLLRKLSSKRFSINFRPNTTTTGSEIQIAHNIAFEDDAPQQQPAAAAAVESPSKFAFASPFKRRGSVAFTIDDEPQQQQPQLPLTDPGEMDPDSARQFKMHAQFFFGLMHNARKGDDVSAALAQFLVQTQGLQSVALRTEILFQVLSDLGSKPIRNESDENGEYVLVKHGIDGSEHVLALLCVLLSLCEVPNDLGPYLLAFVVQRLGRSDDVVSDKLFSLIRFENATSGSQKAGRETGWEESAVRSAFASYSTLLPERPKMQVRKRVLETMKDAPASNKPTVAATGVVRQLFVAMEEEQAAAAAAAIELESKEEEALLPVIQPIRMDDEERELRENFTVCQMMYDFNGEGGEQYLAVSKGDILWLSGLNSSKEWAKVYRREDQRVGWVPLSFVGYPGYE